MMFNLNASKEHEQVNRRAIMTVRRLVTIEQLPEITNEEQGRVFLSKVQNRMSDRRPGLVLDCSGLTQMDKPVLHLLLSCLEEAMKRNGDARLAAVSPSAQAMLEVIGADRLFQIFASNADAVNSFHQHSTVLGAMGISQSEDDQESENAA
jgi:anti-sigma B factor antagonist